MSVWGNLVSLHKKIPSIPLKKDVIVFGRSDKCDIVFDNKIISTNHFILTRINNEVFITDFSSNGTYLNGNKLKKESKTKLKTSDMISLIITGISDPSFEQVGYVYRFEYISSAISSPLKTPEKKPIIKLVKTPEKPQVYKSIGDELSFLSLQASQGSIDLLSKLDSLDNNFEDLPSEEEGTPEKYYNLIKVNPSLSVLTDLNEKLQNCDEEFISDFLTLGGLELLSETLSVKTRNKNENEHIDVNIQLVECIETILNEQIGLNEAMEVKNFFETIALSLDNDSNQVQDTVLKILATGCCFGAEGHKKVIRAFEKYKEKHRERKRFSNLVLKLNTDNIKVKVNTMLLINAIVNIPEKIEDRLDLRKEFLALGVKEMAHSLKIIGNEELDQQLDLFLEEMEDDNEDVIIDNVDISDPVQLASLIRNQVNLDPKIKTSFVCVMHSLSLLPKDNESGQKAWELIENFLQRVLNLGNTTQLEFKEIKDLLENKIEVKEVKKKVGKLEEERKNLQIKLDNITNESSKRHTDLLESHQRELLDLASKHSQKLKTLELDHKQELLLVENKHTSRIQELEKKVDNANCTISKLEKEISELQSRSPNKIVPSKVTTKNIFQMLAYKSLTTQIVPQSNLEFPKLEKAKGEMPGTRVFGISLDSLQARESSQVPIFFSSAISWLESNAMDVEGIFRISGELSKLSELKESIDNGLYFFTENYDPHLISNIVKNFLRELPDPLVEKKYTEALLKINEFTEVEAKIEALQMIFILISESRISLLKFLLQFLSKVSANQSVNKMGPSNLSIVFAPNLFEPLDPLKDLQKLNTLFEFIIINQHAIFEGYPKSILQSYNQIVSSPENLNKAKFEFLEKADPTSANLMKMDQSSDRPSLPSPIIETTDSSPPPMPPPPPGGDSFGPPPPPPGGDMGGMPPPPPFGGGLTNVGSSASLDKDLNETRPKPKSKMRQLYWKKVPNNHISKSIWKELKWDKVPIPASEIEKLFGTAVQPQFSESESTPQQVEKKAPTSTKITIFDVKRSNNIGIMLSQFRGLEASQLRDSIITLNDDILTVENMRQLSKNMATEEEEMALNNYDGELEHLGKVEIFFKTLLEIPQLKGRVESYIYKSTFEEQLQEAKNDVDTISKAIDQLKNSMELKKILALILAIGNFMNYSAFKPATHGFDIEFLPRLADTKTSDKRSTFLHFLAKLMNAHFPEEIKNLFTGLSHVEPSSKLPIAIVSQKVNLLVVGFSQVIEQIKLAKKSTLRNDQFVNVMTKFEGSADREIKDLSRNLKSIEEESVKLLSFYCSKEAKSPEEFFGLFSSFLINFEKAISDNERESLRSEKLKQLKEKRANRQNDKKEITKTLTLSQTTDTQTQSGTDTEKSKHEKFEEKRKLAQQRKKGKAMDNIHLTIRSGAAFPTRQEGSSSGNTVRRTVAKRNNSGNGTTVMNLFN